MVDVILTHCHLEQQRDFFCTKIELHHPREGVISGFDDTCWEKLLALGLSVGFVLMLVTFLFCGYEKIL